MQIFQASNYLKEHLGVVESNKKIGFIPTMGALHAGHLSLIKKAKKDCDYIIVSIFVNPKQFNDKGDFETYPKTTNQDIAALILEDVDVLFLPTVATIYPENFRPPEYDLGILENIYESAIRPKHFQGVCIVVDILLEMIKPHYLFLGQKDYQQCLVIKKILTTRKHPIELIICPIVREANGLAMSSRNERLTISERAVAGIIHECLESLRKDISNFKTNKKKWISILKTKNMLVEYLELVDADNLCPLDLDGNARKILIIAVLFSKVRLLDNCYLEDSHF